MKKTRLGLAVSIALVASASHSQEVAIQSLLNYPVPEGYERAYSEQINVDGTDFFRTGFINVKSGDMIDLVLDSDLNELEGIPRSTKERSRISADAQTKINEFLSNTENAFTRSKVELDIGFIVPSIPWEQRKGFTGSVLFDKSSEAVMVQNGAVFDKTSQLEIAEVKKEARVSYTDRKKRVVNTVRDRLVSRLELGSENYELNRNQNSQTFRASLDFEQLKILISDWTDIAYVQLAENPINEIWQAMVGTGVDPHALSRPNHSGTGIGIYQTEPFCADDAWITNYNALDAAPANSNHPRLVSGIMRFVSPDAFIYCREGTQIPTAGEIDGVGGNPQIDIVNISAGLNTSGAYDNRSMNWDNFSYVNDVAVVKSTGNRGNTDGWATSPGLGPNVLAVGNYDDATDTIAATSSFNDPETGSLKPELSAPGETITIPGATVDSGTSLAAPHVAAMAANYLEAAPVLIRQPSAIRAMMLAGAKRTVAGGADRTGIGGADYYQFITGANTTWWNGGNSYFEDQDSADGNDDGWISFSRYLSSNNNDARVVLTWQADGNYIMSNPTNHQSYGANYDFRIFDPNGGYVGGAFSANDNQYEVFSFNPLITGQYRFEIRRLTNTDTDMKFDIAISINYQP